MQVKLTQESPIYVRAEVELPWEKVAEPFKNTIKTIQKQANLPGFRPGKAPLPLLKKRYKGAILNELVQHVVQDSIFDVSKENNLQIVGRPQINDCDYKENESFHYEVGFEILPEIEIQDNWRGIEVESLIVKVTDEDVEHALEHRREEDAVTEQVTDRGAEDGDKVKVTLTAMDPESNEVLLDDEYTLTIGDEKAHPVIVDMLKGAKAGDTVVENEFEGGEDDPLEELRGKKAKLYLDVQSIEVVKTPALDDEFAKKLGYDDMANMREEIKKDMLKYREDMEDERVANTLVTKIAESYDFPMPDSYVRNQARNMIKHQLRSFGGGNLPGLDDSFFDSLAGSMMPQALLMSRIDVILPKLAKSIGIELTDEEVDKELEQFVQEDGEKTLADIKAEFTEKGIMETIHDQILRGRAVDAVKDAAKITKVESLTPPSSAEAPEQQEETDATEAADSSKE